MFAQPIKTKKHVLNVQRTFKSNIPIMFPSVHLAFAYIGKKDVFTSFETLDVLNIQRIVRNNVFRTYLEH